MNFEALRIISMVLIISSHLILYGLDINSFEPFSFNYLFVEIVRVFTRISVNLYVLITGYYMITSKAKLRKLINLWLVVLFYSITPFVILVLLKKTSITFYAILQVLMPICSGIFWFATIYVVLYILTPFLNKLLTNLNKKQYFTLLCTLFIFLVLMKSIFVRNLLIDARSGASLVWFIYLYMVAGFLRLHYNYKISKKWIYLTISTVVIFVTAIIRILSLKYIGSKADYLLDFNHLFTFISSVAFFLYFREIKIKNKWANKIIGKVAPLMFGIYLIHENTYLRSYIWQRIGATRFAGSPYFAFYFIGIVIMVFFICGIIEYIRMKLFELGKNTKIIQKIDQKIEHINEKFWKIMEAQV